MARTWPPPGRPGRYFSWAETIVTTREGYTAAQQSGMLIPHIQTAAQALATTILDSIRDRVGAPVHINSWFRCAGLNDATPGASSTSQHRRGEAADIAVPGWSDEQLKELWRWIAWESGLKFGQVIFEDRRPNSEGGAWIHISLGAPWRAPERCGQVLSWTPAGYQRHTAP